MGEFWFFYQPELTEEFKVGDRDGQIVSVTETDCFDKDGKFIIHRSIDVIGSYAVYHKYKKNYILGQTSYKTGKFCHIYRPRFIDVNGDIKYSVLDIKDGIYKVAVLKDWIDKAIYPIKANDTFGYTDIGATDDGQPSDYLQVWQATLGIAGDVSKLTFYGGAVGAYGRGYSI